MHFSISSRFNSNRAENENVNDFSEMENPSAFPSYQSIWLTIDLLPKICNGNACLCEWGEWGWNWKDWGEVMLITCHTTSQYISLHYSCPLPRPPHLHDTQIPFHSGKSKMGKMNIDFYFSIAHPSMIASPQTRCWQLWWRYRRMAVVRGQKNMKIEKSLFRQIFLILKFFSSI